MPLFSGQKPRLAEPVPIPAAKQPAVHIVPPLPPRTREVSAIALTPAEQEKLTRHNNSIGSAAQRVAMRFTFLVLLAPAALLMRMLFKVRAVHTERLDILRTSSGIFAIRHFYEADPFVPFYLAAWKKALFHWHMVSYSLASRAWTRTPVLRAVSWCLGVMGLSRGLGLKQSATERAVAILKGRDLACCAIYPTGPIGRRKDYNLGPGVGFMAVSCPDIPVIPVTMKGVQQFRWRDVLMLKRPPLRVAVCEPIYGRDARGATLEDRADDICDQIAGRWFEEESALGGKSMEEPRV